MGAFESGSNSADMHVKDMSRIANPTGVTIALLGLLAPIMMTWISYPGYVSLSIQASLWFFNLGSFGSGFQFIPLSAIFSMFPLLILRMVPAYVIVRYYHGKTTRKRALIGVMVGDILFLAMGLLIFVSSYMFVGSNLLVPLPFEMLAGFLVLWRFPIPEPTKPWEGSDETKPWWERESSEKTASSDANDDKNRLW
jgi:hypothetical protein